MSLTTWKLPPAAILAGLVLTLVPATAALACKYSVRDVGFVDLDADGYRLVLCDQKDADPVRLDALRKAAEASLSDTNVSIESVRAGQTPEHPAFEFLRKRKQSRFPAAVLIAPDGRQLEIPLFQNGGAPTPDDLVNSLKELITSPIREQILERALSTHSVILLVEGANSGNNKRAHSIANEAIETIRRSMDSLPKPVGGPPEIVVMPVDRSVQESVLLWSLGITRDDPAAAHLAVLFGRGRLTGTPLAVPGGTATELAARLEYVGRDCECELDRSWMQGAMFPHRWDLSLQEESTRKLGFDPDSPLVKYDMRRILARGATNGRQNLNIGNSPPGDPLLGYTEMELPDASTPPTQIETRDQVDESKKLSSTAPASDLVVAPSPPTEEDAPATVASVTQSDVNPVISPFYLAIVSLVALGLAVLVLGSFILMRSRRS